MPSNYWPILQACKEMAAALPGFQGEKYKTRVVFRKAPVWVSLQDRFPLLVIAPRPTIAENVVFKTSETVNFGYEVLFGLFLDGEWSEEKLRWRIDRQDELADLFMPPKSLTQRVPAVWNSVYNPSPSVPGGVPANVDASWQSFTFTAVERKGF